MKKAILVHGWEGSPNDPLFVWMKQKFEGSGYETLAFKMPKPEAPKIEEWVGFIKENAGEIDKKTIFVGHSVGCQAILRFMQILPEKIKISKVILIAPWIHLDKKIIEKEGEEAVLIAKPWLETPIDWKEIRKHSNKFICIFSDNDPYVMLSDMKIFEKELDAKTLLLHNRKHFNYEGGIKELPEILQFIE